MGNCANDCSKICGKEGETGEFNMDVIKTIILIFKSIELVSVSKKLQLNILNLIRTKLIIQSNKQTKKFENIQLKL